MNRDEVALRIFCTMMGRTDAVVSVGELIGDNEVKIAFRLADTFMAIRAERKRKEPPTPFPPRDVGGISGRGEKPNEVDAMRIIRP